MKKIYIAGHTGLVGSALLRHLKGRAGSTLVCADRRQLDLTDRDAVERFLMHERPDAVVIAAGRVGGISANKDSPVEFLYENLMIEANLIHGAWKAGVTRLLNFGSSCMYPQVCPQPMRPESLMTGPMEPTSQPYALAKWVGLELCRSYHRQYGARFITAIPATVYGPADNFDLKEAHVLSAFVRRFHEAREQGKGELVLWGTGSVRRQFIYSDDLARACELILDRCEGPEPVHVGPGESVTISNLAGLVKEVVGFQGKIMWDASHPDGAPEKCLDVSFIQGLGWKPEVSLREGIARTYRWFLEHENKMKPKEKILCTS